MTCVHMVHMKVRRRISPGGRRFFGTYKSYCYRWRKTVAYKVNIGKYRVKGLRCTRLFLCLCSHSSNLMLLNIFCAVLCDFCNIPFFNDFVPVFFFGHNIYRTSSNDDLPNTNKHTYISILSKNSLILKINM